MKRERESQRNGILGICRYHYCCSL